MNYKIVNTYIAKVFFGIHNFIPIFFIFDKNLLRDTNVAISIVIVISSTVDVIFCYFYLEDLVGI